MRIRIAVALGLLLPAAALAQAPAERIAYLAYTDGYWQAWTIAPDGGDARQVTRSPGDKVRVSWYPDGSQLLVNRSDGKLVRVSLADGGETPIPIDLPGIADAVLSPDGSRIAFSALTSTERDDLELWLMDADGSSQRKLTNMQGIQHEPAWSADGGSLYFLSGQGGQVHDIWRLELEGGDRKQLTTGALYHFDVAVSKSGDLAFSSNRTGNYEIWVQRGDADPEQLTDHPALDGRPAWSPDGAALAFESQRSGVLNLWRLDGATGDERSDPVPLTKHEVGARAPAWWRAPEGEGS